MTDAEVVAAYSAGRSIQSIADEVGCHRNTVRNRLVSLGVARRGHAEHFRGVAKTPEHRAKISEAMKTAHRSFPRSNAWKLKISQAKGGRTTMGGHPMVYVPGRGRVKESRYVMEQILGRRLRRYEHVHHRNKNAADNRPENLELLDASSHSRLHSRERWANGHMEPLRELNRTRPRDERGRFMPIRPRGSGDRPSSYEAAYIPLSEPRRHGKCPP